MRSAVNHVMNRACFGSMRTFDASRMPFYDSGVSLSVGRAERRLDEPMHVWPHVEREAVAHGLLAGISP